MHATLPLLKQTDFPPIRRRRLEILQVNLGYRCNQTCVHCHIGWQGHAYDCDFNQMLGIPLKWEGRPRTHIKDLLGVDLAGNPIMVADHCYGCTAGQGSSCGGALE